MQVARAVKESVRPACDNQLMDAGTAIAILVILGVLLLGLGAIAASSLGPTGGRVLFLGENASRAAAESSSSGYRTAMLVAAGLAVAGALISLVRGPCPG